MSSYSLPRICANCGNGPAPMVWKIKRHRTKGKIPSHLPTASGIIPTMRSFSFAVPVCEACYTKLRGRQRTKRLVEAVCIVLLIAGAVALVAQFAAHTAFGSGIVLLLAAFLAVDAVALILLPTTDVSQVGYYDGSFFHFHNKNFYDEFARLNPRLVRQYDEKTERGYSGKF